MNKASVAALFVVACTSASAQWLDYPTPGLPRNPNGSPNLTTPTPRSRDGKPDFSGLWDTEKNWPCPAGGCIGPQISQEFTNIGWSLKGGLPFQPWAADLVKARMAENAKDDNAGRCLPISFIRLYTDGFLRKITQVPGLLLILNERNSTYRQIFTDGRPLPEDPNPTWNGYSVGKWDGDTLVVQTNGFRDDQWLDRHGSPLKDTAKVTERLRRVNFGRLEVEITVDDIKTYTRPWTVKLNLSLLPDTELLEYTCLENEKSVAHMVGK